MPEIVVPVPPPTTLDPRVAGDPREAGRSTPPFAWLPIGVIVLVDALLLAATVDRYGYHRDELYFRILAAHPAWGYVDQPPLTPMLVRAAISVFGDNLWALRVPALLFALTAVVLTGQLARELGGGRAAQLLAAAGASCAFVFIAGHVLLTATADLVVWLLTILFAVRALRRGEPRWWAAAGLTVGLGLYNKQLVVLLVIGLVVGLLVAGPRWHLRDRWFLAGAAAAVIVGLPNLVYQIAHGWPEAAMAHAIAAHKGSDDRVFFLPFQIVLLGVTIAPIWITGLIRVLRDQQFRPVRALGWSYLVVSVIVLATGGQPYYTFGLLAFLYAVGCVVAARWAGQHRHRWAWLTGAVATSVLTAVAVALPIIPVHSLPAAIGAVNQTARDSVGWSTYVGQIAVVYNGLPAAEQAHAIVVTNNYGEAGAVARYGPGYCLPPVYSGQNELYRLGPPPRWANIVIAVGLDNAATHFDSCTIVTTLDNEVGIDNEEQGRSVSICRGPHGTWQQLWPTFQHYD
ncbi:MAG: ArnT family glycosyltransferase [Betaproteobacteria bacterium]